MTTTDTTPADPVALPFEPEKKRPSNAGLIVGIVVGGLALLLILPIAGLIALRAGDSISQSDSRDAGSEEAPLNDDIAYTYFGEAEIAAGSSLTLSIPSELVTTTADLEIIDMTDARGLVATIFEGNDGSVRLAIEPSADMQPGTHSLTFRITGEPKPVTWNFTVLAR